MEYNTKYLLIKNFIESHLGERIDYRIFENILKLVDKCEELKTGKKPDVE